MRTSLLPGVLFVAVLTGCASHSSAKEAQSVLRTDVEALSSATRQGSLSTASTAAATLRADVARLRGDGRLSAERAQAINDQVVRVLADLAPRATPTPQPGTTATTAPSPERGKGKGKGNHDGGDNQD